VRFGRPNHYTFRTGLRRHHCSLFKTKNDMEKSPSHSNAVMEFVRQTRVAPSVWLTIVTSTTRGFYCVSRLIEVRFWGRPLLSL